MNGDHSAMEFKPTIQDLKPLRGDIMNITVTQLQCKLVELKNEYYFLHQKLNNSPEPRQDIREKVVHLARTIELMEEEVDRRASR